MSRLILPAGYAERPAPPAAIADAVEECARKYGKHARLEWHPLLSCWCIYVTRKTGDPARRAVSEGLLPTNGDLPLEVLQGFANQAETESLMLHEPLPPRQDRDGSLHGQGYRALDLEQLGVSGVVNLFERSLLETGRGEFPDLQAAVAAYRAEVTAVEETREREGQAAAWDIAHDIRRQALRIPYVRGADLTAN